MTDMMQVVAVTAGTLISAPVALAAGRAFFFFGRLQVTTERADKAIGETREEIRGLVEHLDGFVTSTNERLTRIETEREMEERYGRRSTDRPDVPSVLLPPAALERGL